MLEAYCAFGDYESMMETVEALITTVAQKVLGGLVIETKDAEGKVIKSIDLTTKWKRARYKDLVKEKAGGTGSTSHPPNAASARMISARRLARNTKTLK